MFKFLQEKEGLGFREAVEQLADRYGVELEFDARGRDDERRRERDRLLELLAQDRRLLCPLPVGLGRGGRRGATSRGAASAARCSRSSASATRRAPGTGC